MIEITPSQITSSMKSLFHMGMPTGIRALAVLEGGSAGKVFVDEPTYPSWLLIWEAMDGILYRAGQYNREVLSQAVARLRIEGIAALAFREGDSDLDIFPADPDAGAECLEYDRPIGVSDLTPYLAPLAEGYSICRMDGDLWERSPKRDENLNWYGSKENFLTLGIAMCILHHGEIVSEAYACMDIAGVREIGISTHPGHRGRGLATAACAHLIRLCEEVGSSTYWDCAKLNAGSRALARKLGFQNERAYKILGWFKPKGKITLGERK